MIKVLLFVTLFLVAPTSSAPTTNGTEAQSAADGEPQGETDGGAEGEAGGRVQSVAVGEAQGETDGGAEGEAGGRVQSVAVGEAPGDTDGETDAGADAGAGGGALSMDNLIFNALRNLGGINPLLGIFSRGLDSLLGIRRQQDGSSVVELDMQLTPQQFDALSGRPQAAAGIRDESFRWESAEIPYVINQAAFDTRAIEIIRTAMDEWENYTCIRFVKRTTEQYYVTINDLGACQSQVGFVRNNRMQIISLDPVYCLFHRLIVHELAHTIGLHHEQTRPDRDEHITLHYENIDQEHWHNFDKPAAQYTTNYGLKYDYRSIMHYGQNSFSNNGRRTIETKVTAFQNVIGSAPGVSLKDIHTVNLMYKCSDHCSDTECPGVLSPDCKCWCNTQDPKNPVTVWDGTSECLTVEAEIKPKCSDQVSYCETLVDAARCSRTSTFMLMNCRRSCGWCPTGDTGDRGGGDGSEAGEGGDSVGFTTERGEGTTLTDGDSNGGGTTTSGTQGTATCQDGDSRCASWGASGYCDTYEEYMSINCRLSCGLCSQGKESTVRPTTTTTPAQTTTPAHTTTPAQTTTPAHTTTPAQTQVCGDKQGGCKLWSESGLCTSDANYMSVNCRKSCGICTSGGAAGSGQVCQDKEASCTTWADSGYCMSTYETYMSTNCRKACSLCTGERSSEKASCRDLHSSCPDWADGGYCVSSKDYMATNCPKSCALCLKDDDCQDSNADCSTWATNGLCTNVTYVDFMRRNCGKSCNVCGRVVTTTAPAPTRTSPTPTTTVGDTPGGGACAALPVDCADRGSCEGVDCGREAARCPVTCGLCGSSKRCQDFTRSCRGWSASGFCASYPGYMLVYCRLSCGCCRV